MSYFAFLSVLCGFFIKPQRSQSAAKETPLINQFIGGSRGQSSSFAEMIGRIFCRRFSQSHLRRDYNGCLVAKSLYNPRVRQRGAADHAGSPQEAARNLPTRTANDRDGRAE